MCEFVDLCETTQPEGKSSVSADTISSLRRHANKEQVARYDSSDPGKDSPAGRSHGKEFRGFEADDYRQFHESTCNI